MKIILFALFLAVYSITAHTKTIKVACIGDSITEGSDDPIEKAKYSYPGQLNKILGHPWEVKNFGVSGTTILKSGDSPYWNEPTFKESFNYNPEVVIIMLGTNDSKSYNWKGTELYTKDFKDMIALYKNLKSVKKIYLGLPPPAFGTAWFITPWIIRHEIIPSLRQIAMDEHLETIDFYTVLSNREDLFPDKIHPNTEGAYLMAMKASDILFDSNWNE